MLGWLFGRDVTEPHVPPGITVRAGRIIPAVGGRLSGMRGPAGAVTFGRTIILHPRSKLTPRLLRHELAHVRQWQRWPVTFPLRYIWHHLQYGYRDNPFEVEARAAEDEH
jgi:hypothetical protein